jgi:hypothetical protein
MLKQREPYRLALLTLIFAVFVFIFKKSALKDTLNDTLNDQFL